MANQEVSPVQRQSKPPAAPEPDNVDAVPEGDVTNYGDASIDPYTDSYDHDRVGGEGIDEPLGVANRQPAAGTEKK